jgi:hypothetical protein
VTRNERKARREQWFAQDQKAREIVQRKKELKIRQKVDRKARKPTAKARQEPGISGPPQATPRMRRKKQIKLRKRKLGEEALAAQTSFERNMSRAEHKAKNEARECKRKGKQEQHTPKIPKSTASMPREKQIEVRRVVSGRKP